jgi:hypothetical protein
MRRGDDLIDFDDAAAAIVMDVMDKEFVKIVFRNAVVVVAVVVKSRQNTVKTTMVAVFPVVTL